MKHKAVAVGGEYKGNIQRGGVFQRLLHPVAHGMVVVLGLDQGDGNIGLVIEDVIGALGLAARDQLAADDDAALGETDFLANLEHGIPSGLYDGGRDELGADVAFAEVFFVHGVFNLAND